MKIKNLITFALLVICAFVMKAQVQPVPLDSAVRHGVLDNGLTYYIRHNALPENRAEFYIVQKVGSINEEESQRGLAHFLEHMAFNGTKNFPKKDLINYLQENGVKFGNDLNAYTAFDETVYNISNVPTHRKELVDSCLLILHDWSGFISLEEEEIDAERKVIHEEWRTRNSAALRIYDQILPTLFPDSCRYAYRMPIGIMEVVDNFPYQQLRDYYHEWYRPELQGIVIVGDINPDEIEDRIKTLWSDIPRRKQLKKRLSIEVADNETPIVAIGKDKELTSNLIEIKYKHNDISNEEKGSISGLADSYIKSAIESLLSLRFSEIMQQQKPPFMGAAVSDGDYVVARTKKAFTAMTKYKDNEWEKALVALIHELKRVYDYGFTASEYERLKTELRSITENAYKTRSERRNEELVESYLSNFLHNIPAPDEDTIYKINLKLIDSIDVNEINNHFKSLISHKKNLVITLRSEDKEGKIIPSEEELLKTYHKAWNDEVEPYEDKIIANSLMSKMPQKGSIVKESFDKKYNATIWKLSNGAIVYLRHSDRDKNQIGMTAISKGGYSLIDSKDYYSYSNMNSLAGMGGLGDFSNVELGKVLTGKQATYQCSVGPLTEQIDAGSTIDDVETMLQLVYLRFTTMRQDTVVFNSWKERRLTAMKNRNLNPMVAVGDTLTVTMYGNNPRNPLPKVEDIEKIDYDRACELFSQRYANAGDFAFIFVGNFDIEKMRPLVEQYIASLPSTGKKENHDASQIPTIRKGHHIKQLSIPMESPKTTVLYNITANVKNTQKNRISYQILRQVLSMMYTEQIREQEGGTYGVSVSGDLARVPKNTLTMFINFDTNEAQAQSLLDKAISILNELAQNGPDSNKFNQVKEYIAKRRQSQIVENSYFMSILKNKVLYNNDDAFTYDKTLNDLTEKDVQRLAKKIASSKDIIQIIMNGTQK